MNHQLCLLNLQASVKIVFKFCGILISFKFSHVHPSVKRSISDAELAPACCVVMYTCQKESHVYKD